MGPLSEHGGTLSLVGGFAALGARRYPLPPFATHSLALWSAIMPATLRAALAFVSLVWVGPAWADEFRVETQIFEGDSAKAVSRNTTLFRPGVVYDFLDEPASVAIFDKARQRFVLLNPQGQLRTEIALAEVTAFCRELRTHAASGASAFLKFAAYPQFDVDFDDSSGKISLASKLLSYDVQSVRADRKAADQFREFSDAYVQLNAMLQPGSLPPFARMALNAELARRDSVPVKISLTIPRRTPLFGQGLSRRSEHQTTWRLLDDDLKRIAATDRQLTSFKKVPLLEFREAAGNQRVASRSANK
jgi:hypothetical protein